MKALFLLAFVCLIQPARAAATAAERAVLEAELARVYPAAVTRVAVEEKEVVIEGHDGGEKGPLWLADIPMDVVAGDPRAGAMRLEIPPRGDGSFQLRVPRQRMRDGREGDRLTSRWQIVRESGEPVSHARYAGEVACAQPRLPEMMPRSKKGLGGWNAGRLDGDLENLGIAAVTVNVMLDPLVAPGAGPGHLPVRWQGRTWFVREAELARLDATFLEAQRLGVMVSAILLVGNPARSADPVLKILGHPDATREGIFAMPNVTSEEGLSFYGALLDCMAERWSRADGKFGRVHHWILHNEVDFGWEWTNAGAKPAIVYLDLYQRSLRLMDLIARSHDTHSRAFISLTHHWADKGNAHGYGSKRLLDLLADFCRTEGDFPWALAYHPYPQDLFKPRAWEDTQATFSFDTAKITPRNLEVLDAYLRQPRFLHQGQVRAIHLSENGFNSPDYGAASLADQAAGMAMAWKKIQPLESIRVWHYHNWIDNRGEGGLRIGLRKFPDDAEDPGGPKPIWHLYQALGTERENEVAAPYLKTLGISSWDEVIHRGEIR